MVSFAGRKGWFSIYTVNRNKSIFFPFHESMTGLPLYNIFKLILVAIGLRISLHYE
jgi:hypothetical protein